MFGTFENPGDAAADSQKGTLPKLLQVVHKYAIVKLLFKTF